MGKSHTIQALQIDKALPDEVPNVMIQSDVYYVVEGGKTKCLSTPVYDLNDLKGGMLFNGPAIILN